MSLLPERYLCLWITTTTVTTCQIIYQIIMVIMGIELFSHVKTFFCFKKLHICGTCQWKWLYFVLNCLQETLQVIWSRTEKPSPEDASYCQTHKTLNTWKISGMLIVYWPITIKFRIRKQTSKPQTNYHCCLRFSYLTRLVYFL